MTTSTTAPLFVLGILPRSGTNFFFNLLRLHPQCKCITSSRMNEDYLLYNAGLLVRYSDTVCNYWRKYWKFTNNRSINKPVDEDLKQELLKGLGNGLVSYLNHHNSDERILATKTPQVRNLKYFFKLFPNAKLVILIRDGRAVVESLVKSFGWSYERASQQWAEAAKTIIDFDEAYKDTEFKYLIIKYEDLLDNLEEELSKVFKYLNLDVNVYNFDVAMNLPVMGSSQFWEAEIIKGSHQSGWKRVEKTPDFQPKVRWMHWSNSRHERFNWIAGDYMVKFGYEEKCSKPNQFLGVFWHKVVDKKWQARNRIKSSTYSLEKNFYALYSYSRSFRNFISQE